MGEMSWERKLPVSKMLVEVESGLFGLEEHLCFGAAGVSLPGPLSWKGWAVLP